MYGGLFRSAHYYLLSFAYRCVVRLSRKQMWNVCRKMLMSRTRSTVGRLATLNVLFVSIPAICTDKNMQATRHAISILQAESIFIFDPFLASISYLDIRVNCFCQQIRKTSTIRSSILTFRNVKLRDCQTIVCAYVLVWESYIAWYKLRSDQSKRRVYTVQRVERNEEKKKSKKKTGCK